LALEAFRRIRAIDRRARMVVAGDGPLRKNLAQQHPDVLFTGALPLAELARHYASADVFLFPSQSETFGNVLLEACASGLTTVSFDYAAPKAYITHDDNGLVAPFGNQSAWLSVAESIADDRARCARLRRAARATAETIGWDAVIDRFEGYVRQVVDAPATPGFARHAMSLHRLFVTPSQQDGR
jgi:glycosyltransferase involved in cell wall biosynthesis